MQLTSFYCAVFVVLVFVGNWSLPSFLRNVFLLIASYLFFSFWDWRLLVLISFTIIVDYLIGLRLGQDGGRTDQQAKRRKKLWLTLSICIQLSILCFFKYINFIFLSLADLIRLAGWQVPAAHFDLALPIGISFYTWRTLTYTIDVYRGQMTPVRNLLDYALYLSFFPVLLSGPIERAKTLLPQITAKRTFQSSRFFEGLQLIAWGVFKKVYVADNLSLLTQQVFSSNPNSGFQILVGVYSYAFQIYADFSGYTDMARGCGKMLGFDLMLNFNNPYWSKTPSEFWQRWHISLSTWLRDYLFLPLGGAFRSPARGYLNLMITMTIAGLWHGAAWTFIVWGFYQGGIMVGHRILQPHLKRWGAPWRRRVGKGIRSGIKIAVTFHLVCFGWLIFACSSLSQIGQLAVGIFRWERPVDWILALHMITFVAPMLLAEILSCQVSKDDVHRFTFVPAWSRGFLYGILFYLVALHGSTAQSFIYAQF